MLNKNDENEKDNDLNLSDMINEYEEDSVLRKKIEALKAEKAQEEAQRLAKQEVQEEVVEELSSLSNTMQLPRYSSESVVDATFLDEDSEDDSDKTIVIMDAQAKREFDDNESILYYGDHEVDAEEITEEDIEEFLSDENVKKQRKPMDPKKMNKIVTYVMSAIVGLCVLVGGGFGLKMAFDAFQGEEASKPVEKEEKPTTKDPVDKPTTETPVEKPNENESNKDNGTSNNAIKIAEINGSIKAKQQQVTDLNTAVSNADTEIANITKEIETLDDQFAAKEAEFNNISNKVNKEMDNVRAAEAALAAGSGKQEDVDRAKAQLETVKTALKPAEDARNEAKRAKESKDGDREKKMKDKQGYLSQISTIQLEIDNLQKELQSLK